MRLPAVMLLLGLLSCDADRGKEPRRLLLIGWDGATYRMIDRLVDAGKLPTVERLMSRGVHARLESTIIPISSAAWTSAVTGKGPGETGVYGFFEPLEDSYDVRLISSRSNKATPLWRILTRRGKRSIVFGVPITYPPEPIFGTMVTGMLSPFRGTYAYPPELTDELRSRGFEPDVDVWMEARVVEWPDLERQLTIKQQVLTELLEEDDWDLAMIVFKSLDVVSHLAYAEDFYVHTAPVYERLDKILGDLLALVGTDTNVMLVSDHGFHVYGAGLNLHSWLVESGFSVRKEKVKQFTIRDSDPLARRGRDTILQIRNELDWSRTRAFATTCEGNFGSLRFNIAGREPEGSVPPAEANGLFDEIAAKLRELRKPDGSPLVTRVLHGDEYYPGPARDVIPDLLFELDPEWQAFTDVDEPGVMGAYDVGVPDHDGFGIFIGAGPSFADQSERGLAQITDVAPTALHLLGQPVYAEMTGKVLTDSLRGLDAPTFVPEAEDPSAASAPARDGEPYTEDELAEIQKRLDDLGYTDG
jgi:predicted AlkP superfamily phosphohydrolase/phosphomutase